MSEKTKKLRQLISGEGSIIAPCIYDAISARAVEATGFEAAGTTGFGMHGSMLGMPDNGVLAFNEMVNALGKMADSVNIPIMADAEGGYGNAINTIRTIREFEKVGIAGLFIEDQKLPTNCPYVKKTVTISIAEMVGKLKAALDARQDEDFIIVARTDASGEEAVERSNIYLEAGADMVKVIPHSLADLQTFPKAIKGPIHLGMVNGKEFTKGLSAFDMFKFGYKIVTFPFSSIFSHTAAVLSVLKYIKENGTDEGYAGPTMNVQEYLKFVGIEEYKEQFSKYVKS